MSLPTNVGQPTGSTLPTTCTLASFGSMRTSTFLRYVHTKPSGPRTKAWYYRQNMFAHDSSQKQAFL